MEVRVAIHVFVRGETCVCVVLLVCSYCAEEDNMIPLQKIHMSE